jgi:V/A-type H+-transporting ATPase subunit A
MTDGVVRRVSGPLVEVDRVPGLAMAELVEIGAARLPAEVVALLGERATTQAYEYTGGVAPGDPVRALGRPLSARLGPGLPGQVFDGLLRPLTGGPTWLGPGAVHAPASAEWQFTPVAAAGVEVAAGDLLGTVEDAGPLTHRVLVPPGLAGHLDDIAPAGRYRDDAPIATVAGRPVRLAEWWPVRRPRPYGVRLGAGPPLLTGQRVLDVLYPLAKGSAAAVPGGFGTGKTMLLQQIAKWCDADLIVYVGCGERGNELADVLAELAELADPRTGGRLADRTVLIANTSNMPIMAREASIYTGMTVAEYYRDMGYDAVVIADSTSRWAEALREFASRTGALPAEEGYPAGLASALAAFYERAGRAHALGGRDGSVTVVGAVSPPGGDMTEPVTAHTQRFVRTLWTLDRDLAYSRHYPAVSWHGSYCRDAAAVGAWYAAHGDPDWASRRARMVSLLADADRLAELADLVGTGALPGRERMIMLAGRLLREAVLQQSALSANDAHCSPAKAAALVDLVLEVAARLQDLVDQGVEAHALEGADLSGLVRAREETGPDDAVGVGVRRAELLDRLGTVTP